MPLQQHNYIRKIFKLLLILVLCVTMSSCWSSTNIEDQAYITAIGLDYKDGEYYAYGHEMNFKEIDEPEKREGNKSKGIVVGTGVGKTIYEAALSLVRTSQGRIDWGHIEVIVLSEEVLKKDNIGSLLRRINRFHETRSNCWLFVTNESIEEILSTSNLYDDASLRIVLYDPTKSYKQFSITKPILAFKAVANYFEPDRTVILPVISLNNEQWISNDENLNLIEVSSAFITSQYGNQVMLKPDETWLLRATFEPSRFPVRLVEGDETVAVVSLITKKKEITSVIKGTEVSFNMNFVYAGTMFEYTDHHSYEEIVSLTKQTIEADIREAFALGLEKEIDILNLMPSLRQKYPAVWRELTNNGKEFILTEKSLENINISLRIPFNGKYKRVSDDID